jgi:hypothetical protein
MRDATDELSMWEIALVGGLVAVRLKKLPGVKGDCRIVVPALRYFFMLLALFFELPVVKPPLEGVPAVAAEKLHPVVELDVLVSRYGLPALASIASL